MQAVIDQLLASAKAQPKRAALVVAASVALVSAVSRWQRRRVVAAQQKAMMSSGISSVVMPKASQGSEQRRARVDALFFRRLRRILAVCVPGWLTRETAYISVLTLLLLARTGFTVVISEILGGNAQALVSQDWQLFLRGIGKFALITLPASAVNSGLKYFVEMLALRFRLRLSEHVLDKYLSGVNYYRACNLGQDRIDHADQRVTSDIEKFSHAICELYTQMFKPTLDIILFTTVLVRNVGWQGPFIMYMYFVFSGYLKRAVMPSFGKMVARESELEGAYRTAHQRLITNSEEIAFYDGAARERKIIDRALQAITTHISGVRWLRSLVGVFDGLLVKYWASIAGYAVVASPMLLNHSGSMSKTASELTNDYIRNTQHLTAVSHAVGDLVLVGNKLTTIAGYTSRVSELLEMVYHLSHKGNVPFQLKYDESDGTPKPPTIAPSNDFELSEDERKAPSTNMSGAAPRDPFPDMDGWLQRWRERCEKLHDMRIVRRHASPAVENVIGGGTYVRGEIIRFNHVDIVSPEGKVLVRDLHTEVPRLVNVMITGPNGAGKSSVFRVIGELWPLHSGTLTKPRKEDILFVPQKPYLVIGTLRDQIIYPHSKADMEALGVTDDDLAHLLAVVDPAQTIASQWSWDEVKDWLFTFSGGQKQRVAMARLFYHCPAYAVMDECTSAVSDEVEDKIYQTAKKLGITLFTVSHRKSLARHHDMMLHIDGRGGWEMVDIRDKQTL